MPYRHKHGLEGVGLHATNIVDDVLKSVVCKADPSTGKPVSMRL